ncbi:Microtubule-associated protein SPIRAL2-like [Morella rubra]|uniref:Microtubule-associated protein SPIRAL2-like n=1 Tax=Morella rubra TaxID=262757 RepID=A0A6A1VJP0_9ROSI|nr:Microtubule-associated protein SPIRAL2-like [Morella rubra]
MNVLRKMAYLCQFDELSGLQPKKLVMNRCTHQRCRIVRSLSDSTVDLDRNGLCFQTTHGCCSQISNDVVCIRKQLLEIENKQSNLLDLLQVFTTSIMESLTSIQSRVVGLEHVVGRLAQDLVHGGQYSDLACSKLAKQSQSAHSPRLSTCTPRPSVDIHNRQPSLFPGKSSDIREVSAVGRCRSSNAANQDADMWTNRKVKTTGNPTGKDMQKCAGQGLQNIGCGQIKRADAIFASASRPTIRRNGLESQNNLWKRVKGFLCDGDLDSAYLEALCSHDELVIVELLDRTGPVLENLSPKTVSDILGTLASYLLEQRFLNSITPWLQQASSFKHVVDLSIIHGPNYLVPSVKARREFLSAIQEAVNMEFSSTVERRIVTEIAMKLYHAWETRCTKAYDIS